MCLWAAFVAGKCWLAAKPQAQRILTIITHVTGIRTLNTRWKHWRQLLHSFMFSRCINQIIKQVKNHVSRAQHSKWNTFFFVQRARRIWNIFGVQMHGKERSLNAKNKPNGSVPWSKQFPFIFMRNKYSYIRVATFQITWFWMEIFVHEIICVIFFSVFLFHYILSYGRVHHDGNCLDFKLICQLYALF